MAGVAKGHPVGTDLGTLLLPSKPGGIPLSLLLPVSHDFWEDVGQGELHNHLLLFGFNRVLKHVSLCCPVTPTLDKITTTAGDQIHFILLPCNKECGYFIKN